jgi:hypothetical protein
LRNQAVKTSSSFPSNDKEGIGHRVSRNLVSQNTAPVGNTLQCSSNQLSLGSCSGPVVP